MANHMHTYVSTTLVPLHRLPTSSRKKASGATGAAGTRLLIKVRFQSRTNQTRRECGLSHSAPTDPRRECGLSHSAPSMGQYNRGGTLEPNTSLAGHTISQGTNESGWAKRLKLVGAHGSLSSKEYRNAKSLPA